MKEPWHQWGLGGCSFTCQQILTISKVCLNAGPKPFCWAKPACLKISSSDFTLHANLAHSGSGLNWSIPCEFEDISLGLHRQLINPLRWKESVNKYLILIQGGILSSIDHFGNSPFPIDTYAILLVGCNPIDTQAFSNVTIQQKLALSCLTQTVRIRGF
jgi:hypothetical protein